ncbi:MAG: hypothetical protein DRI61_00745 [Chloroflexi bacterium]|nr:MAG: hypothetical protein DRI61_00745 [Chloroflexota bacterium]
MTGAEGVTGLFKLRSEGSIYQIACRFLLIALFLWMAFALRLYRLDAQSLWADEGNSAAMALRDLPSIALHSAADIHPPLYYWILRLWAGLLGISEWALRSLSAFIGLLLVAVVYALGKELLGEKVAVGAMLLAAFCPFQIYYSQEARMYILVALLASISLLAALQWWRKESPVGGGLYVLSTAAGFYSHYSFPLMLGVENLAFLVMLVANGFRRRMGLRRYVLGWLGLQGLALFLYAPWMPVAYRRLSSWPAIREYDALTALREAARVLILGPVAPGVAWLYLLIGLTVVAGVVLRFRKNYRAVSVLGMWLLAPLAMMLALGLFRGAYLKFLLVASPAFCILVAMGIASFGEASSPIGRWLARLMGTAILMGVILAFSLSLRVLYFDFTKDDYRGMAHYIEAVERPGDAIILDAPGQEEVFRYYYRGNLPIYPLPRERPPKRENLEEELALITSHPGHIFALFWATNEADPDGIVENWLERKAFKVSEEWKGNVRFAIYTVPELEAPFASGEEHGWQFGSPSLFRLTGYVVGAQKVESGGVLPVMLTWQAERETDRRYKVTVQLLNENNQVAAQYDAEPEGGRRPTNTWQPGEVVVDNIGVMVRPGTPPGHYLLILAMYDANTGQRLEVKGHGVNGDHIEISTVEVTRPAHWPPLEALGIQNERKARFGPLELLGYDVYKRGFEYKPDASINPGDIVQVNLYWRAELKPQDEWFVSLSLVGANGEIASVEAPAAGIQYPTTLWEQGEIVRAQFDLFLPRDMAAGKYRLFLKMRRGTGGEYLPPMELSSIIVKKLEAPG